MTWCFSNRFVCRTSNNICRFNCTNTHQINMNRNGINALASRLIKMIRTHFEIQIFNLTFRFCNAVESTKPIEWANENLHWQLELILDLIRIVIYCSNDLLYIVYIYVLSIWRMKHRRYCVSAKIKSAVCTLNPSLLIHAE